MDYFNRIICIVLDGVGAGELPDAGDYGDEGSSSISNTASVVGGMRLPNMGALGLGNIVPIDGVPPQANPEAYYGRMRPLSPGKDSTSGHWELMGCVLDKAFPTYPNGFPGEVVSAFEKASGVKIIGNRPASGTEIIMELGAEHIRSGRPILYTSQDSVFQIAAHEDVIPVGDLYEMCSLARKLLVHPNQVARIIARPFAGEPGRFYRTHRRKDFSIPPIGPTVLDTLVSKNKHVTGIGKIDDLFDHRGISRSVCTKSNRNGMDTLLDEMINRCSDLILTNLVDFDMMWGHRNDARAYAVGLEEFDSFLPSLKSAMGVQDLLIITSDHGCDPTMPGTDHSREHVPLLVFHKNMTGGGDLGLRSTFADVGMTIADNFSAVGKFPGKSFLSEIEKYSNN